VDEPTPDAIAEWRAANNAGWKRAAKQFGLPVAKLHAICDHTPRHRARACASCETLRAEVAKLRRATTAEERVRGSRVEFLRIQLAQALGDLDDLRGQERTGTAISVQTRTVAELRAQLDDEEHRLLEASGDPIEQMSADELVADIAEVIRELPDMLHDQIAAVVLERYGQEPELLLG
jgi:hypothetical protein